MKEDNLLLGWLPNNLSDEAAYELYLLLERLTEVVETQYFAQIRRHIASIQPPVPENWDLWNNEENRD